MMVLTHIAVGGFLAGLVSTELILAGMIGGLVPDLDIATWQHRKDLHFPVYYSVAAISAAVSVAVTGSQAWLLIATFFGSAALHSWMDAFGGGLEMRPWLQTDDRGVYNHYRGEWIETRHWVYDGSPGDLLMMLAAVAGLYALGFSFVILAAIAVLGTFYSVTRKIYPRIDEKMQSSGSKPSETLRIMVAGKLEQLKDKLP